MLVQQNKKNLFSAPSYEQKRLRQALNSLVGDCLSFSHEEKGKLGLSQDFKVREQCSVYSERELLHAFFSLDLWFRKALLLLKEVKKDAGVEEFVTFLEETEFSPVEETILSEETVISFYRDVRNTLFLDQKQEKRDVLLLESSLQNWRSLVLLQKKALFT